MKKAANKTIRYSLLGLVLLAVLLFAAPFFIDANQYKSLIVDQVEKATGRQIEIGKLHASLFPWVGVRMDDVHIANPRGFSEPGGETGDFLYVKSLDVQVALLPLIGGRYKIERFVLDAPKLQLVRDADGFSNWEDLSPSAASGTATTQRAAAPSTGAKKRTAGGGSNAILAALSAQSLRMNNGEVHYRDARSGRNILLNKLNIEVDDVQMKRPISVRVSANLGGDDFSLNGKVGPLDSPDPFNAARLPLKGHFNLPSASLSKLAELIPELSALGEGKLSVDVQLEQHPNGERVISGSLELHNAHKLAINLRAQMPDTTSMQIEYLKTQLDDVELAELKGTLRGLNRKLHYEMRVNTPELTRQQLAAWLPEINTMYAAHPAPWDKIKLGMLVAGNTKQVDIRNLQLLLNGELLQASGNVNFAASPGKGPDIRLRIASRDLHLDPWLPQPAAGSGNLNKNTNIPPANTQTTKALPAADSGPAQAGARIIAAKKQANAISGEENTNTKAPVPQKPAEPDLRFLKAWKIAAVVQVDRLFLRGLDMSRLRADVSGKNGIIRINPLHFELAGGNVEEKASLNVGVYPARWSEAVKVREVQLQPVLKALADNDMLTGKLQMDTHLSGIGLLPDAAVTHLNGKGNLLLRDGSIKGMDIPGTLRNIRTLGQGSNKHKKTDFSQLSGSFKINNGIVKNDDLFMASPLFRLTGYGMVNLIARQMDYHLKPRLVGSLVGQGDTQSVRKGLEVPLRLVGPLNAPQIKLEVNLKTLIDNKEAVRNIIKNRKSIFKSLFKGRLPQTRNQQTPAAANPQSEPIKPARIKPAQPQTTQPPAQKPLNQLLNKFLPGL